MSRPKKNARKVSAGNKLGHVSQVAGVYFRDDGKPRWFVRFRQSGKKSLPTATYPVDLKETNKASDVHVETARKFAEAYALKEQARKASGLRPMAQQGVNWTLKALINRVLEDFENDEIEHKPENMVTSLRTWVGLATRGHNRAGFPTITQKRITELKYKHFYSLEDSGSFNNLLKDKAGERAAGASVKKMLKALQYVFKRAHDIYEIEFVNPLITLKSIEANDARSRVLTDSEFESIIAVMREGRTLLATMEAVRFARFTAVRRAEAVKLDWTDINFVDKTAHLRGTKAKRGAFRERVIPLPKEAMQILNSLYLVTEDKKGPVFAYNHNKKWRRLRADTTTQAWIRSRARVAAATKDDTILTARLHDLRHTRITELGSIPALTVTEAARISGHTDLRMFMRYFNPNAVDIGKKLDDYERAQSQPKAVEPGKGTIDDAIAALVALGDKASIYVALGKAMEKLMAEPT